MQNLIQKNVGDLVQSYEQAIKKISGMAATAKEIDSGINDSTRRSLYALSILNYPLLEAKGNIKNHYWKRIFEELKLDLAYLQYGKMPEVSFENIESIKKSAMPIISNTFEVTLKHYLNGGTYEPREYDQRPGMEHSIAEAITTTAHSLLRWINKRQTEELNRTSEKFLDICTAIGIELSRRSNGFAIAKYMEAHGLIPDSYLVGIFEIMHAHSRNLDPFLMRWFKANEKLFRTKGVHPIPNPAHVEFLTADKFEERRLKGLIVRQVENFYFEVKVKDQLSEGVSQYITHNVGIEKLLGVLPVEDKTSD